MTTQNPASVSPLGRDQKSPQVGLPLVDDPKCLDIFLNFFFINFSNIRGLTSNFQSVEYHLSST
ncbi:hypothetical protein E2C01_067892 [Portunus trituberculatus]|uniref:Uncharacterized protein n=1 Tax=Portunus trituberculatus TaxID=210409 RepID=A0A5B7HY11_PORTR|nr:hypothetical protein [Portunus trituberculatus]